MNIKQAQIKFEEIYKKESEGVAFTPYRICPLGAHSDHQLGKITGFAINKGISIVYRPKHNDVVEMVSLQFDKRAQWHINSTPEQKENDWADHLRGATISLKNRYSLICSALGKDIKPIYGLDRPGDIKHSNADISKARKLLNYDPEYSFADGIKLAIDWYKENLK